MIPRLKSLLAIAALCAVSLFAAEARAYVNPAVVYLSPAWNVGGVFTPAGAYYFGGQGPFALRQTVVESWGYAPYPLPPPPYTPTQPAGTMMKVFGTGIGTCGDIAPVAPSTFATYSLNPAVAEIQLRCQSMGMSDALGPAPQYNPQLVSVSWVQCSVYTHAVGGTWTYKGGGTAVAGAITYRPPASCGNATGCWQATVSLTAGGNFAAWIN
jgi:hypothetical protein